MIVFLSEELRVKSEELRVPSARLVEAFDRVVGRGLAPAERFPIICCK